MNTVKIALKKILPNFIKDNTKKLKLSSKETELIKSIKNKNITFLSETKLGSIIDTINAIKENRVEGIFIEAGCALGGSTALIATIKNKSIPLCVYDVFGLIPAPTEQDTEDAHDRYKIIVSGKSKGFGEDIYYGYQTNLYETVIKNLKTFGLDCKENNIVLIKGLLQETMQITQPVAFAHIDVDWYEPVKFCLENICPQIVTGGSMILDDYHDWGGCRKAVDEYLRTVVGQYELDDSAGSMKITKIK
jgi:asparagine synthase (glutamine-hydrolysing)